MGHKVNPIGMRLQVNRTWDSRWYADTKDYGDLLLEDLRDPRVYHQGLCQAGRCQPKIIIERPHKKMPGHHPYRASRRHHRQEGRRHRRCFASKIANDDGLANCTSTSSRFASPSSMPTLVAESIAQQLERQCERSVVRSSALRRTPCAWVRSASGSTSRAALAVPRSPGPNGTARAVCRCTPFAPTSTMPMSKPRRLTASSASRSGSSRARSWSTIQVRRVIAKPRNSRMVPRPVVPAAAVKEGDEMLQPKRTKFRKHAQGPDQWRSQGRFRPELWHLRPEGDPARACHRASDRGRAPRHDAPHETSGPCLDPHLPGYCR